MNRMRVSKAFRCALPSLREDQLNNLRCWAEQTCAMSTVFRDGRGLVLVALKDAPRSSASFARTVRTALRRRGINTPLRGHWCTLTTVREALAVVGDGASTGGAARQANTIRPDDAEAPSAARAAHPHGDDTDVRVVSLTPLIEHFDTHGWR